MRGRALQDVTSLLSWTPKPLPRKNEPFTQKKIEVKSQGEFYLEMPRMIIINFKYINTFNLLQIHFLLTPECLNAFTMQYS